jgi:hypothetical protein
LHVIPKEQKLLGWGRDAEARGEANPLGNGERAVRYMEEVGEEEAGLGSSKTVTGYPDGRAWPRVFGLLVEQERTLDDPIYLSDDQLVEREPRGECHVVVRDHILAQASVGLFLRAHEPLRSLPEP